MIWNTTMLRLLVSSRTRYLSPLAASRGELNSRNSDCCASHAAILANDHAHSVLRIRYRLLPSAKPNEHDPPILSI